MKHTGSSSSYTLPDELKDNIIEIGDNVVKAFSELKETAARKSFYVNTISCKELADKKISFILLGNKNNPSFKKLADIIDAELQGYFYNKKMKAQKPDRATDSLVNLNRDSIRFNELYSVLNNTVIDQLNKVSQDYLLVVNNLTSFEGDETPAGTLVAKYFSFYSDYGMRMKAATAAAMSHNYTGGMAFAGGLIETISAMSVINNMNSYGRISCEVCFVDVKKNQILLKNQLYVIEGIGPKSTPADLAAKIGSQMRDCDLHVTDVTLSTAGKKSDHTIPSYGFKSASCDQQWGKIIGSFSLLAGGTALLIIGGAINKEDSPSGAPFFILGALSITGSIPLGIVGGIKQARYFECRKRYQ